MTEPSYFPLSDLKSPQSVGSSSLKSPFTYDPDPPHLDDDAGFEEPPQQSHSSMYLAPLRPQLFRPRPGRPSLWRIVRSPLKMALLPLAALGYLAFCYSVHGKVVPVNTHGPYSVTPQHLSTIKGAITSISIIVVSIALYPVYDVLSNLKSEEFFRVLSSHSHGVRLETINHISNPSFGNTDTLIALWRRTCSNYYSMGVAASLLVWTVAALAPGALTTDSVLADGEIVAFAVGAAPPQSVLNASYISEPAFNASLNSVMAASITWAEMELGVQYSYKIANTSYPDYVAYIVPAPLDLPSATSARWLSDVIGINPMCSWASTNLTLPLLLPFNLSTSFEAYLGTASLLDFDLDVPFTTDDLPGFSSAPFAKVKDPTFGVFNHTTQAPATDGSTVFLLGQCLSGCTMDAAVNVTVDFKGLPTITFQMIDQTWSVAILACMPNITIETREVRSGGDGVLNVQPRPVRGKLLTRQGNLHPVQTTSLFSIATLSLSTDGGTLTGDQLQYSSFGSQVQADLLFGKDQFSALPGLGAPYGTNVTLGLAPLGNITEGYTRIIQSAAKSYLGGYLGKAYVPARISTTQVIFTASMPIVAVSTVLFAILTVLLLLAHFRSGKGTDFTLINVAAAVHGSELPAQFAQMKAEQWVDPSEMRGDQKGAQQDIAEMLGERKIFLQRRVDGSGVLHIS
ncbi:hypothetical protein BDN67DRAFT_975740 [Paxillus ammoniavirescens]|nr:hypothetical protein BDN67DRAFT_975740 [Paxillus ammoniavirescens]